MAKASCGTSLTLNLSSGRVEFAKVDIHLSDIDLDLPVLEQLENFDVAINTAMEAIKDKLKEKIRILQESQE
jgi:hypothetical protein